MNIVHNSDYNGHSGLWMYDASDDRLDPDTEMGRICGGTLTIREINCRFIEGEIAGIQDTIGCLITPNFDSYAVFYDWSIRSLNSEPVTTLREGNC